MTRNPLPLLLSSLTLAAASFNVMADTRDSPEGASMWQGKNVIHLAAASDAESEVWDAAKSANSEAGYRAYLKAYPKGRYAVAAKIRLEGVSGTGASKPVAAAGSAASQSAPPPSSRPALPIAIDNSVWQALENSTSYRNAPKSRAVKVEIESSMLTEHLGSKNSTLPPSSYKKQEQKQVTAFGDKCYTTKTTIRTQIPNMQVPDTEQTAYVCGLMVLMGATSGGKPQMSIANLQVNGSLFPPQLGATQSVRYTTLWLDDAKFNMDNDSTCNITGKISASSLHAKLTGTAWVLACTSSRVAGGKPSSYVTEDYLLEDLGLLASGVGAVDTSAKRVIIPAPGSTTVFEVPGDYGVRMTTTYDRYDILPAN